MSAAKFGDNDKELVERILAYRKEEKLPSFVEAVRRLCKYALDVKKAVDNK